MYTKRFELQMTPSNLGVSIWSRAWPCATALEQCDFERFPKGTA